MERNYLQEMQDMKSSILQEIREILTKSENETHTFKDPFYVHWADGDGSNTDVCYNVTKGKIGDGVLFGVGSYESTEPEEDVLVNKYTDYSTETLVDVLNRLREETKELTVRIVFTSEVHITGKSLGEIKEKFDGLPIFSADELEQASAEFVDIVSVEDESHKDLLEKYNNA